MLTNVMNLAGRNAQYLAWTQACVATFGSLYFSEVLLFPPCTLCWYQRILMYPLTIILAVGILRRDQGLHQYVLPLSGIGFAIALYHNLLYFGIIPEGIQPCTVGIPCTTVQIEWFGFVTIPLMSLTAFTVINVCVLVRRTLGQEG